jgi:hypothetical protein
MDFFSSKYNENYLDKVAYKSDHSMIILSLVFNPFNKGKGLWKFNNSLLYEKDYSKIVREKMFFFSKRGGGRPFWLQAPVISTIYFNTFSINRKGAVMNLFY